MKSLSRIDYTKNKLFNGRNIFLHGVGVNNQNPDQPKDLYRGIISYKLLPKDKYKHSYPYESYYISSNSTTITLNDNGTNASTMVWDGGTRQTNDWLQISTQPTNQVSLTYSNTPISNNTTITIGNWSYVNRNTSSIQVSSGGYDGTNETFKITTKFNKKDIVNTLNDVVSDKIYDAYIHSLREESKEKEPVEMKVTLGYLNTTSKKKIEDVECMRCAMNKLNAQDRLKPKPKNLDISFVGSAKVSVDTTGISDKLISPLIQLLVENHDDENVIEPAGIEDVEYGTRGFTYDQMVDILETRVPMLKQIYKTNRNRSFDRAELRLDLMNAHDRYIEFIDMCKEEGGVVYGNN